MNRVTLIATIFTMFVASSVHAQTTREPKFEKAKKTEDARLTLVWNGVKVHDNVHIPSRTHEPKSPEKPGRGPIILQENGYAVQFRNIWILPAQ